MENETPKADVFQVEIDYKAETTQEEKDAAVPFIQAILAEVHEVEGTEDAIPACVDALTIRRSQSELNG